MLTLLNSHMPRRKCATKPMRCQTKRTLGNILGEMLSATWKWIGNTWQENKTLSMDSHCTSTTIFTAFVSHRWTSASTDLCQDRLQCSISPWHYAGNKIRHMQGKTRGNSNVLFVKYKLKVKLQITGISPPSRGFWVGGKRVMKLLMF